MCNCPRLNRDGATITFLELNRLSMSIRRLPVLLSLAVLLWSPAKAADQQWQRVSSDHFVVLTDASAKKGQEIAARFEQMRAVFGELLGRSKLRMSQPIDIIAFADEGGYRKLAPLGSGRPTKVAGFALIGDDRTFFVLDASQADSYRAIEHQLAHYFLQYNYPPTQSWFDEGIAEYFASLSLTAKEAQLGTDPELHPAYEPNLLGESVQRALAAKSLTQILSGPVWLRLPDLFAMKNRVANGQEGTHSTMFYAQSWMLVHYLVNKNKLAETGRYLQLVMSEKMPVEQAVQQAYGMSVTELDQAVKDYFHSLKPLFETLGESERRNPLPGADVVYRSPLPFPVEDVAVSTRKVPAAEATARVDEMELRIPERSEAAVQDLQKLTADEKTDTTVAHRALAWWYMQKKELNRAYEQARAAIELQVADPWVRYYLALITYHSGEKAARAQGLANMMESLQVLLDEFPEFAEAYNMLGWARLTGGGANSAVEAMKMAVQLSPRDEGYQLRLARAYLAAKKYDDATSTLQRLAQSRDPAVEQAAKKDLKDLPFLKKYGVPPEEADAEAQEPGNSASSGEEPEEEQPTPKKPQAADDEIDRRPVRFLKGRAISVECSGNSAVVTFSGEGRTLKLHVLDRKQALVIGAPAFSCAWKNIPVNVNYRTKGRGEGDLVSIEVP
jgi:tetratricopeptide (TPR) repeat protein